MDFPELTALPTLHTDTGKPLLVHVSKNHCLFNARLKVTEDPDGGREIICAYFSRALLSEPWVFTGYIKHIRGAFHATAALAAWASENLGWIGAALPAAWEPAPTGYKVEVGDILCNAAGVVTKVRRVTETRCATIRHNLQRETRGFQRSTYIAERRGSYEKWHVYPAALNTQHQALIDAIQ